MSSDGAGSQPPDPHEDASKGTPILLARRMLAESVGTFFLVSFDSGGAIVSALSHGDPSPGARSAAAGLVVMALAYAMGDVSGAHFNPAVTLAFALRKDFPWARVPFYWAAQLLGAFAAAGSLLVLFGDVEHLGATLPRMAPSLAFAAELLASTLLVAIILGTATRHRVLGANAALASAGAIAVGGLIARSVSGASMNPARSLAPAVVSGTLSHVWIYLIAPLLGAMVATLLMAVIHSHKHRGEGEAARGNKCK